MNIVWGILLSVSVWFDGVEIGCVVDTGSQVTVMRESVAAQLGTLGAPVFTQQLIAANGTTMDSMARRIPNVGTRELGWSNATVLVVPDAVLHSPCILGSDLLGRQPVVIDWASRRVVPVSLAALPALG